LEPPGFLSQFKIKVQGAEMPTLTDVARIAGVGIMSVSRVVNGTRRVSSETERKVRAAIERIGYEPNEAARILKGQRSSVLGLIVPDLADPFYATCANAVQRAARLEGYLTWMAASSHREDVERDVVNAMIQRHVAGLLVIPSGKQNDHFARAAKRQIPIVSIDRPLENIEADALLVDNRAGTTRAIEHLIGHGHKRILCISDNVELFTRLERITGYAQAMRHAELLVQVCTVEPISRSLSDQLAVALNSSTPPTAIFAENNIVAVETIRELQNRSLRIPEDIAIIAFDDFDAATLVRPAITVVSQPVAELGRRATELICSRLDNLRTSSSSRITLNTELVIRQSCGCGVRRPRRRMAAKAEKT
jgi:LacI family transcriptional regulator